MSPSNDIEEEWPWEELETDAETEATAAIPASADVSVSTAGEPLPVSESAPGVQQEGVVLGDIDGAPVSVPVSAIPTGDRGDSSAAIDSSSSSSSSSGSSSISSIRYSSSSSVEAGKEKAQDIEEEDDDDDDEEDLGVDDFAGEVSRPPSVRESHGGATEEIVQLFEDQTVEKQSRGSRTEIKSDGAQTVAATSETAVEEQTGAVRTIRLEDRDVQGVSYEPVGTITGLKYGFMGVDSVFDVAAISSLCNDAQLEYKEGQYGRIGEPTEAALKVLVEKLGVSGLVVDESPTRMARQCSDYWSDRFEKLAVLEFDRDRKSMSVLCREKGQGQGKREGDGNVLFVKGAAEVLITRCNRIKLESGRVVSITPLIREQLNSKLQQMARKPLRNLALAYREGADLKGLEEVSDAESALSCSLLKDSSSFQGLETDMVLVGFCGIKDPARPEVAEAILKCTQAAVRIMMITGDSKETAVAIAREVNIFGILEDVTDSAYTSKEFFALPMEKQLSSLRRGNKVFCRAEPKDKQILISMLEQLGEVTGQCSFINCTVNLPYALHSSSTADFY
jgi:Cation transport ATPase (P-type)